MKMIHTCSVLKFSLTLTLTTPLRLCSGNTGEFADSEIARTPDGNDFHINGNVWASLIRRAVIRVPGAGKTARIMGDYNADLYGVSPLWCESFSGPVVHTEIRPGIVVDPAYGTTTKASLHNHELLSAGHRVEMNFNWFCLEEAEKKSNSATYGNGSNDGYDDGGDSDMVDDSALDLIKSHLEAAFAVIHSGVETIGGGWSYGFGRLAVEDIRFAHLNFKNNPVHQKHLFQFPHDADWWDKETARIMKAHLHIGDTAHDSTNFHDNNIPRHPSRGSCCIRVRAGVAPGQLLAVKSTHLPMEAPLPPGDLPDGFVFRSVRVISDSSSAVPPGDMKSKSMIVIPGKVLRQGLFARAVARRLRSRGSHACDVSETLDAWFGSVHQRGAISIADAPVDNPATQVLHRIQLCEHSLQNNNLFAGEYLNQGDFTFDILIDPVSAGYSNEISKYAQKIDRSDAQEIKAALCGVLEELCPSEDGAVSPAPPGWYRIGTTAACTGQIQIHSWEEILFTAEQPAPPVEGAIL